MKQWRSAGLLFQLSWVFAISVLLPLLLGVWLTRMLGSPLFLFIGALLGILAGTVGSVVIATRAIAQVAEPPTVKTDAAENKEDKAQ